LYPAIGFIFQDDFSQDALADFPLNGIQTEWQVTTLNGLTGRWLELKTNTR